MTSTANLLTSAVASGLRGWQGISARTDTSKPARLLKLYDIENCPYCRLVREVLTELDLDAIILPCPKGGELYRPEAEALGGQQQFPFLVDENTGTQMYESLEIVHYLYETYGGGSVPLRWRLGTLQKLGSGLASAARLNKGMVRREARQPESMPELYSFEGSPYARPVRELLCDMEIAYILRSCGRSEGAEWLPPELREKLQITPRSALPNRVALLEREGKMGIPYLYDPNTGAGLFESDEIIAYLEEQYA